MPVVQARAQAQALLRLARGKLASGAGTLICTTLGSFARPADRAIYSVLKQQIHVLLKGTFTVTDYCLIEELGHTDPDQLTSPVPTLTLEQVNDILDPR
jgi:hypothetical protein